MAQVSCGAVSPGRLSLTIVNKDRDMDLLEVKVHTTIDNYRGYRNLLKEPLKYDHGLVVQQEKDLRPGQWYVTAVREKIDHGALIALTTKTPLDIVSGDYELWVFEQSFRFWRRSSDGGAPDSGPADARGAGDRAPGETRTPGDTRTPDDSLPPRDTRNELTLPADGPRAPGG
jgi:hypothetical protein